MIASMLHSVQPCNYNGRALCEIAWIVNSILMRARACSGAGGVWIFKRAGGHGFGRVDRRQREWLWLLGSGQGAGGLGALRACAPHQDGWLGGRARQV